MQDNENTQKHPVMMDMKKSAAKMCLLNTLSSKKTLHRQAKPNNGSFQRSKRQLQNTTNCQTHRKMIQRMRTAATKTMQWKVSTMSVHVHHHLTSPVAMEILP